MTASMVPHPLGAPTTPLQVVISAPELVRAGLTTVLAPHAARVSVETTQTCAAPHVEIFDPVHSHRCPRTLHVPRVALSWHDGAVARQRALDLGAVRVLPVDADAREIVAVLEQVRREHRRPLDVEAEADGSAGEPRRRLTPREADVLSRICRGLSNEEIGRELFLSINSVKTHIRTAYRKIGATRRSQAVLWGLRNGY